MIVTLTGDDHFGLQVALKELTEPFVQSYGDMALERLDGADTSFERIQESLLSPPFLSARKMIVLRSPSANKRFAEQAETLFTSLSDATDAILVEPKLDKRSAYYKLLKSSTNYKELLQPDENGLAKWLCETAIASGGNLNLADARYLVERIGLDRQLLANELEKLLLYDPNVTCQTIRLLTEPAPQSTVFELLEAAFRGQTAHAIDLYHEQRALKVDPSQIVAMLTWQLWAVALIKTAGDKPLDVLVQEAKINPYVIRKSHTVARGLTLTKLKQLITELLTIDVRSKRESIDLDEALQHYLLTLSA